MLAGCQTNTPEPLERQLPAPPAFAAPVEVPVARAEDSCYVLEERQRNGRKEANKRLLGFGAWYAGVRKNYSPRAAAGGRP